MFPAWLQQNEQTVGADWFGSLPALLNSLAHPPRSLQCSRLLEKAAPAFAWKWRPRAKCQQTCTVVDTSAGSRPVVSEAFQH